KTSSNLPTEKERGLEGEDDGGGSERGDEGGVKLIHGSGTWRRFVKAERRNRLGQAIDS
ncbi:hypothetical protein GWI33_014830, partial [Rhynchophorus ferrugineus]